jgi:hypothetical protein
MTSRCGRSMLFVLAGLAVAGCKRGEAPPPAQPPGAERSAGTAALESGAAVLQDIAPVTKIAVHLVGFHPMKDRPEVQMEAHHYCNQVNEDFAQCVLFDGNTANANMNGLEFIISEKLFEGLPQEERAFWHPHNYELLSGQLAGPGLPDAAEKELMRRKMNSYGKTWHVWMDGDKLPLGEAHLAWSFNRDGEARAGLVEERDRKLRIDSGAKRRDRADLVPLARPQSGVDALRSAFPNAKGAPEGVRDKGPQR